MSKLLAEKADCKVDIGALRMNMFGRVILDNVNIYDQRDTLMLQASRIAAKVDLLPLVEKKIRISGAQLIGTKATLYKDGEEPYNFQFLMDAFSSKDTTSTPLDLGIGALVVRRGEVRFDRLDEPTSLGKFNPNHLHVTDLSLTARIFVQKPDTIAIDLRNLSFREQSGLHLKHLSFEAKAGKHNANVQDFKLELPETIAQFTINNPQFTNKSPLEGKWEGNVSGKICPRDLACLVPQLKTFGDIISVSSNVQCSMLNGQCSIDNLSMRDNSGNISLQCNATISDIKNNPSISADIKELRTGPALQQFLTENMQGQAREISPILTRLGGTKTSGTIIYQGKNLRTNLLTESEQGTLSLDAILQDMKEVEADITATDIRLGQLLELAGEQKGTTASLEANVTGTVPGKDRQAKLSVDGLLSSIVYKGYEHRNIHFTAAIDGESYSGMLTKEESNGQIQVNVLTAKQQGRQTLQCQAQLKDFDPNSMNLTKSYKGERFSGSLNADFSDIDLNNLQGELRLTNLEIASEKEGKLHVGDIVLNSNVAEDGEHLTIQSDFFKAKADGNIHWQTLPTSFVQPIRQILPSLFQLGSNYPKPSGNDFRFLVQVQDTILAQRLLNTSLRLPEQSILDGTISDAIGQIFLQLHIPQLHIGGQQLQNLECRAEAGNTTLQTSMQCERVIKGKPVELNLNAFATNDKVTTQLRWDNKQSVAYTGNISMTSTFRRDLSNHTAIDAKMNKSNLVIGDSLWQIKPATIKYHDNIVDVEDLSISQAERHINIGGRVSELASDTLRAELADIDISYIMDLVNFHKVDFDGRATGSIYATSLMKKPLADAFLHVKEFTFNTANLGDMDLHADWGKKERTIQLEADMRGPLPQHSTQLRGTIVPVAGNGLEDGLDLNIHTKNIDLSFLSKYTKSVFSNLHGRASGWTRVFGPFKYVNLEGNMFVNEMKMHVMALGTDYHVVGDSVIMRPDNIWLRGVRAYDDMGSPGMNEHYAIVDAHLMHKDLKDLSFDINIDGHNILGYNFPNQDGSNFYGIAYGDAQVKLTGEEGTTTIDVNVTPTQGTTLIYNVATPGTVTETEFITYSPPPTSPQGGRLSDAELPSSSVEGTGEGASSDLRINFEIHANPDAQIRILMDPRTGDNITLYGNGLLRASYYNKGRFQLFGTYRVSEGNYRMSIRDLIRKDFTFQPDGTIVFGGDAMQAALNLKAIHTVPNVSLDDLSATGLGLSNTRVDCIMNIGGNPQDLDVTFDFDIPNANEDEKQMVRSMLSSEEERDMQAIYLLGVGRFYTFGSLLDTKQTKGGMAINSVLSSAISSRFNQIMSQAL
ncbi:MAG: translocation/assembly module TamB domain-containing protein, partial [Bacteroidaceae bacterium]|nr:translocation/assembly module TamB domain-containing protein [Bacteroidaceae bacterium]